MARWTELGLVYTARATPTRRRQVRAFVGQHGGLVYRDPQKAYRAATRFSRLPGVNRVYAVHYETVNGPVYRRGKLVI